jgi:type II secretory pathway pseudopilin PulG
MLGADVAKRAKNRLHDAGSADGFTLIELLLVISLTLIILGGTVGILIAGVKSEPRIAERTADIQAARVAMERLTREIRQGVTVTSATGSQFALVTNVNSATCGGAHSTEVRACRVTYSCSAGKCTRTEVNPDGSGTPSSEVVLSGITSTSSVFSYSPSAAAPAYIEVKLEFPSVGGDDSITLSDGVSMRNAGYGS